MSPGYFLSSHLLAVVLDPFPESELSFPMACCQNGADFFIPCRKGHAMQFQWINQVTFLGSRYIKPEVVDLFAVDEGFAVGICPGKKKGMAKKQDGNEDSLSVFTGSDGSKLALLSDSHYGAKAGEICVSKFHERLQANEPEKALFTRHMEMETVIEAAQAEGGASLRHCATTLLSLLFRSNELIWANTGDSYLFLVRDGHMLSLSQRHPSLFLGEPNANPWKFFKIFEEDKNLFRKLDDDQLITFSYLLARLSRQVVARTVSPALVEQGYAEIAAFLGQAPPFGLKDLQTPWSPLNIQVAQFLPEWGRQELRSGDLIFATTDGAEVQTSGLDWPDFEKILAKQQPRWEAKLQELFSACLGRHGGMDNLAMVLARI